MTDLDPNGNKILPNSKCYCNSGEKFKKCCRDRDRSNAFGDNKTIGKILEYSDAVRSIKSCSHPEAPNNCTKVINAHTISKSSDLEAIALNHEVIGTQGINMFIMKKYGGSPPFKTVKAAVASTFYGFCGFHDKTLFEEYEDEEFLASPRQIGLLMFRTICKEIKSKQCIIQMPDALLSAAPVPNNLNCLYGRTWTSAYDKFYLQATAAELGLNDFEYIKGMVVDFLFNAKPCPFRSVVFEYESQLPYSVSGVCAPTHTISGKMIQNFNSFATLAAGVFVHTVHRNNRSSLVISWLKSQQSTLLPLLLELTNPTEIHLEQLLLEFPASFVQTTFYSPSWYNDLDQTNCSVLNEWKFRYGRSTNTDYLEPFEYGNGNFPLPRVSAIYSPIS